MKNKNLLLLSLSLFALAGCSMGHGGNVVSSRPKGDQEPSYWNGTYQNPLFVTTNSGNYYSSEIADPCVVKGDDGYFYAFATGGRVLISEDGCAWSIYKENIIPRPTWGDGYATNPIIWAPDVVKIGEQWIYYYSLSAWGGCCGIGYAISDAVGGPYTDQGMLFASEDVVSAGKISADQSVGITNSIDQQVIIDGDSVYMIVGSFVGCYLFELNEDGMGLKDGIAFQREHKILIAGTPGGFNSKNYEGSWVFEKDGLWYYMGSTGSCCDGRNSTYHVVTGIADNIAGPYYDSEHHRLDRLYDSTPGDLCVWSSPTNDNTKGPGHHCVIVDDAGDYWWYGHCYYEYDNFVTRHLAMDKLEFDENEMPYIEGKQLSYNEEFDGPRWLEVEE